MNQKLINLDPGLSWNDYYFEFDCEHMVTFGFLQLKMGVFDPVTCVCIYDYFGLFLKEN